MNEYRVEFDFESVPGFLLSPRTNPDHFCDLIEDILLKSIMRAGQISCRLFESSIAPNNPDKLEVTRPQKLVLMNVLQWTNVLTAEVHEMGRHLRQPAHSRRQDESYCFGSAMRFSERLTWMAPFLPLSTLESSLGGWSKELEGPIHQLDLNIERVYYTFNRTFNPEFKPSRFLLSQDIYNHFLLHAHDDYRFQFDLPEGVDRFFTADDYFTNAVLPLVQNVYDHGLGVGGSGKVARKKEVYLAVASEVLLDRSIQVTVLNHGCPVDPSVSVRLFEKNVTTKTDTSSEHGLGLYNLKQFVEGNGGKVGHVSAHQIGTRFSFTIPHGKYELID